MCIRDRYQRRVHGGVILTCFEPISKDIFVIMVGRNSNYNQQRKDFTIKKKTIKKIRRDQYKQIKDDVEKKREAQNTAAPPDRRARREAQKKAQREAKKLAHRERVKAKQHHMTVEEEEGMDDEQQNQCLKWIIDLSCGKLHKLLYQ
eukprot:TRINITY_DN5112_c0_g1_i1.p1 TRINITY_DN5112_c0_g1~~TRINITY_DN5112_c0_g1_i1.p1  ORF type:complete len:147 (+),score=45.13 TRINITY_DN5112_c0_g1_i1:66-506(+)